MDGNSRICLHCLVAPSLVMGLLYIRASELAGGVASFLNSYCVTATRSYATKHAITVFRVLRTILVFDVPLEQQSRHIKCTESNALYNAIKAETHSERTAFCSPCCSVHHRSA
jgi:hypothetical protein